MNKNTMGWIVAAVLAVVLGGALIFQAGGGAGLRSASIGGGGGQGGPPPDVAADLQRIKDAKDQNRDRETFAKAPPGQEGPRVSGQPENTCDPALSPNVFPEWRSTANNLQEANGRASQIVVATVQTVAAGNPLVADAPTEEGGRVETPTQRVTLLIEERVKGRGPGTGETMTIESLGDGERGCFRVEGDPQYRGGERYLLLLEEGKGGRPAHTFAPEGRWRVNPDGTLASVAHHSRMADVAGQKLEGVVAKLRG